MTTLTDNKSSMKISIISYDFVKAAIQETLRRAEENLATHREASGHFNKDTGKFEPEWCSDFGCHCIEDIIEPLKKLGLEEK